MGTVINNIETLIINIQINIGFRYNFIYLPIFKLILAEDTWLILLPLNSLIAIDIFRRAPKVLTPISRRSLSDIVTKVCKSISCSRKDWVYLSRLSWLNRELRFLGMVVTYLLTLLLLLLGAKRLFLQVTCSLLLSVKLFVVKQALVTLLLLVAALLLIELTMMCRPLKVGCCMLIWLSETIGLEETRWCSPSEMSEVLQASSDE